MINFKKLVKKEKEIAFMQNMVQTFMNTVEEHLYLVEEERDFINIEIGQYNKFVKSKIQKSIFTLLNSCADRNQKEKLFLQYLLIYNQLISIYRIK